MDEQLQQNKTKRILVFEDSDIFADMLVEFLEEAGYVTGRAINGFEGIKQVYTFLPHLIITDVEMPLFKGYQATRLLKSRKNTRDIPIIMFTTLGETKDRFWGGQAGADCYIEKSPNNFQELRERITGLLAEAPEPNFKAIEQEGKRVDDNSLIETVNNLLDHKLFQTTLIGMLTELSGKIGSLEEILRGFFDLLTYVCEAEIASVMIKSADNSLFVYTANHAGFVPAIVDDFTAITIADFDAQFPDYKVVSKKTTDFYSPGEKKKPIESYIVIPLFSAGERFATVHVANSIKEYFSPVIMENINVFLYAAAPVLANALSILEMEKLQKKTRLAFARYVPEDVMDEIIRKSQDSSTQSEIRNLAILFADIRNFTKISENSGAQDVVTFLNAYFSLMGNKVIAGGGHVDKFIGDAIMAIFGVPKPLPNAPAGAISAAIKMISALPLVDTSRITVPKEGLAIGIGINYGECVVGNIGFQDRMDYTVIGDTVNLASRLEGTTKLYRHPIIVSEYMYNAAKELFIFRKADNVRVIGKNKIVELYAVYAAFAGEEAAFNAAETGKAVVSEANADQALAGSDDVNDRELPLPPSLVINRELLDQYNKGLKLFYMREWETARHYFLDALKIDSGDYLSSLYLERTETYIREPPPADQDITTNLTEK
ncbi:MAG: response regulator [Spirochaetaceae bacterium]|jgi:class 3 adenylate cyclase/DNA-binding response OmpR family regulator|nr:response regulator [Spirochaetaceae bacterium]